MSHAVMVAAFTALTTLQAAVTVRDQRMTRDPGATCDLPVLAESFTTADNAAYVWFKVFDAKAGDLARDEWFAPDGALFRTGLWNAMQKDGNFCMWAKLDIAGAEAAGKPGRWQVKVYWNDIVLFAMDFEIASPTSLPRISTGGVVNAADYTASFAPGCIFSVFGTDFSPTALGADTVPLPQRLAGVSVEVVDGDRVIASPLFFVSANQINAQLPFDLTSPNVRVRVRTPAGLSNEVSIVIQPRTPRIFTQTMDGRGEALVLHADYSFVRPASPAQPSEVLILYLTGLGAVNPPISAGAAAGDASPGHPLNLVAEPVEVLVGGRPAEVLFAGLAPGFAGLYQINFRVPAGALTGAWEVVVRCGHQSSQQSVRMSVVGGAAPAGAIGPEGGTLQAQHLTVTVPPGAFNETASLQVTADPRTAHAGQVTPVFTISGVPLECAKGMKIAARPNGAVNRSMGVVAFVRVAENAEALGRQTMLPDKLEARFSGDLIEVDLPPWDFREAPDVKGPAKSGRRGADASPIVLELSFTGGWRYADLTGNGLFRMSVATSGNAFSYPDSVILDIQRTLEQSKLDFTRILGLSWPERNWPMNVYVYDFMTGGAEGQEGAIFFGKSNQVININAAEFDPGKPSSVLLMKRAAAHELFHVLQNLYNPTWGWTYSLKRGRDWDWFFEACSAWWEVRLPGPTPVDIQVEQMFFFEKGLEGNSASEGYGASLFPQFLANVYGVEIVGTLLKRVERYDYWASANLQYVPSAALLEALPEGLSSVWRRFGRTFMEGKLFSGVVWPDADRFSRERARRFLNLTSLRMDPNDVVRHTLSTAALSGKFFTVAMPSNLQPGSQVTMTLDAGPDFEALVYGIDTVRVNGVFPPARLICAVTRDAPSCAISDPVRWSGQAAFLAVLAINSDVRRPFTQTQTFALEFRLTPDPLAALKQMPNITAVIGSPVLCSGTAVSGSVCEESLTLSTSGRNIWDLSPAAVPAWNDLAYTATASSTSSTTTKKLEIIGSLDSSGAVLKASGRFWLTEKYTNPYYTSETTYGFGLKDLPLVRQRPSAYDFEIKAPEDWKKYVTGIEYKVVRTQNGVQTVEKQNTGLQWPAGSTISISFWKR